MRTSAAEETIEVQLQRGSADMRLRFLRRGDSFGLRSILLLPFCLLAGCGVLELTSEWRNREVIVDGKNTEWLDSLTVLDDSRTMIGICNDREYLYLGLITTNQDLQRQIRRRGITFWFDRSGGKDKTFGINYPIGLGGFSPPSGVEEGGDERAPDLQGEQGRGSFDELELYGPREGEHHRMTMVETGGILARFQTSNEVLVYELRVPLTDNGSHPFAIGAEQGARIGVGIETTNGRGAGRVQGSTPEGRGGRGGVFGGGGRKPRGASGGRRSRAAEQGKPLSVWAKVQLAADDQSTTSTGMAPHR